MAGSDHYVEAIRLLEASGPTTSPALSLRATVHAALYVGEQIEVLTGILATQQVEAWLREVEREELG